MPFVEDNANMSSIRYFENQVSYYGQKLKEVDPIKLISLRQISVSRALKCILGSNKKSVHFLMLNISKISKRFFCKFGMVSPKYTIDRSNIKPIPCWVENFSLYGNT